MRRKLVSIIFILTLAIGVNLLGGTKVVAAAANLSHSYKTNSDITAGSLVSVDSAQSGYVVLANIDNSPHLLGVTVTSNDSLLAVNVTPGQAQVALSGTAPTLVSTLNGKISSGDQIAVSPINGVGMKADSGSRVIGIAQADFATDSSGAKLTTIKDKNGKLKQVSIGYIPIVIDIGTNVPAGSAQSSGNFLQKAAADIVGHPVSTLSVVISSIIALVAIVALIVLIYGTIRGSLLSIGRNPLAKPAIFESLVQVIGMALLIVVIATVSIYLLMR